MRDKFEDRIHDAALQEEGLWTSIQCAPAPLRAPLARACVCVCPRRQPHRASPRPVACLCAGAPAIYTQRALRTLASLVSGREITSDAELLDGVAMVRVSAGAAAQRRAVLRWRMAQRRGLRTQR